jgi:hypothetical protein
MKKTFTLFAILAIVAVASVIYFSQGKGVQLGRQTIYEAPDFLEGLNASINRSFSVSRTGSTTVPAIRVDSGSYLNEHSCATASYNPASFSSSTIASTTLTMTGAAVGDLALASFATTTSSDQWRAVANVTGSNQITVSLVAIPGSTTWLTGLDIGSATVRACYFGY